MYRKDSIKIDNLKECFDNNKDELSLDEQYGKLFPLLYDKKTREQGYEEIEKLLKKGYLEAGIVLGQYYSALDKNKASSYFSKAMENEDGEACWGSAGCMPHNYIPQDNNQKDDMWVFTVASAAINGCPDAMLEFGNIEHRRKSYFLSAYWYFMADVYEHPQASISCIGIAKEWDKAGRPSIPSILKDDLFHIQGELFLRMNLDKDQKTLDEIYDCSTKEKYVASSLFRAKTAEEANDQVSAFMFYKKAAAENDIYANRCCADMLMVGNGCEKNIEEAKKYYEFAASRGEKNSCFVMGEFTKEQNKYLAISWYAKAYVRGMEQASERIKQLSNETKEETNKENDKKVYWRNEQGQIDCLGDNCVYGDVDCPDDCPISINTKALSLMIENKYEDAIELYKEIVEIAPDFKDVWNNLGAAYGSLNDHKNSYDSYKKAYELNNKNKSAIYGLSLSSMKLGKFEESLSWCDLYDKLFKDRKCDSIRDKNKPTIKIDDKIEACVSNGYTEKKNIKEKQEIVKEEKKTDIVDLITYLGFALSVLFILANSIVGSSIALVLSLIGSANKKPLSYAGIVLSIIGLIPYIVAVFG